MRLTTPTGAFWARLKADMMSKPRATLARPTSATAHPLAEDTTVLLLGWAGARENHLNKYSELYLDRGFNVLRYTAAFDGRHPLYLKNGRNVVPMLNLLDQALGERKKLLIHTYSMNGVFCLAALLYRHGYSNLLQRTTGIVMDSGPVYFDTVSGYTEVLDVLFAERTQGMGNAQVAISRLFRHFLSFWMVFTHNMGQFLLKTGRVKMEEIDAFRYFVKHPDYPKHQLYLYSDADNICKSYMTKEFVAHRRGLGDVVDDVNFVDSEHVQHFRTYTQRYTAAVDLFLQKIADEERVKIKERAAENGF